MLEKNPEKRATTTEILEHVWFKDYKKATTLVKNPDSEALFHNIKSFNGQVKLQSVMM